jgi:hypothetical protein
MTWRNSLVWTALAGALAAALLVLALSAAPAQSAERSASTPVTGGKTLLKLDGGTAAVPGRRSDPPVAPCSPSR